MAKKRYAIGMGGIPIALPAKPKKTPTTFRTRDMQGHPIVVQRTTPQAKRQTYKAKPLPARKQDIARIQASKRQGIPLTKQEHTDLTVHKQRMARKAADAGRLDAAQTLLSGATTRKEILNRRNEVYRQHEQQRQAVQAEALAKSRHRVELDKHGFKLSGIPVAGDVVKGLGKAVGAIGVAAYHDPIGVPKKTIEQGVQIVKGIPSGAVSAVVHPEKTIKQAFEDTSNRLGKESFSDKVKRIRKEGAAADLTDIATVAPGAGAVAKEATIGKVADALKAERPALRVGGTAVPQEASRRLGKRTRQLVQDKSRQRAMQRRVAKAVADPTKTVPADMAEAFHNGEVVPIHAPARAINKVRQQRVIARTKVRNMMAMKRDQARAAMPIKHAVAKMTAKERQAVAYAAAHGYRDARAVPKVQQRIAEIEAHRAATGVHPLGGQVKVDELPLLREIAAHPEKYLTPQVAKLADEVQPLAAKVASEDPRYSEGQILQRRYAQQAQQVGVRRGELPPTATKADVQAAEREVQAQIHRQVTFQAEGAKLDHTDPAVHAEYEAHLAGMRKDLTVARDNLRAIQARAVPTYAKESVESYVGRVRTEAQKHGLAEPTYVPSEGIPLEDKPDYAAHAIGGARAMARQRRYEGKNYTVGLQDMSPQALVTGLARNIKAKHNHELIDQTMQKAVLKSWPGAEGKGATISTLEKERQIRQVDPKSVAWWNPGLARKAMKSAEDAVEGEDSATLHDALEQSFAKPGTTHQLAETKGWFPVTRAMHDEIMAGTKPSGAVGRAWEIAKGKQSAVLLTAGNVPWLTFQVAANALQGLGATSGKLFLDMPRMIAWKRALPDDLKDDFELFAGSSPTHDATHSIKLGATADNWIVNGYRTFKASPFWDKQVLLGKGPEVRHAVNIFHWFRTADRKQTELFRETVLYDKMRRQAFDRMGANLSRAERAQGVIANVLKLDPEERMTALLEHHDAMEESARAVDEFMGDYLTYTNFERKTLNRSVMFYGYLRYSMRFAFYTMPMQHPIMTGILAKLSQLHEGEIRGLLGGDNLPWNLGKVYFTKDGKLESIDLARANPLLNSLVDIQHPTQLVGLLPPIVQSTVDQAFGMSTFRGKAWKVNGKPADPFKSASEYGGRVRARVFVQDMLSTAYPYRMAQKMTQFGAQGDDAMLGSPRPTQYSTRTRMGKALNVSLKHQAQFQQQTQGLTFQNFMHQIVPLLPQPSNAIQEAKDQKRITKAQKPLGKHPHGFGVRSGSSAFGVKTGGSSSSTPKPFGTS